MASTTQYRIIFRISILLLSMMVAVATVLSLFRAQQFSHQMATIRISEVFFSFNRELFFKIFANNILLSLLLFCLGLFKQKSNYICVIFVANLMVWAWNYSGLFLIRQIGGCEIFLILLYLFLEIISYVTSYLAKLWKNKNNVAIFVTIILGLAAHIETVLMR